MLCGLLVDAAFIGIIIAVMEQGEFPGWGPSIGCALAVGVATNGTAAVLPDELAWMALGVGALVGGVIIHYVCHMEPKRALLAASIYLGLRVGFALSMYFLIR